MISSVKSIFDVLFYSICPMNAIWYHRYWSKFVQAIAITRYHMQHASEKCISDYEFTKTFHTSALPEPMISQSIDENIRHRALIVKRCEIVLINLLDLLIHLPLIWRLWVIYTYITMTSRHGHTFCIIGAEFPTQRQIMQRLLGTFAALLNKLLNKQTSGRWN